jgi:hypothetical protein
LRRFTTFAATMGLIAAMVAGPSQYVSAAKRGELWFVVHDICLPAYRSIGVAFPCLEVNIANSLDRGFAVLQAPSSATHVESELAVPMEISAATSFGISSDIFIRGEIRHLTQDQHGFFSEHALFVGPSVYLKLWENANVKLAWSAQIPDETTRLTSSITNAISCGYSSLRDSSARALTILILMPDARNV